MILFRLHDNDKCDAVLFFDAILFLTRPLCSKGTWASLWYAHIKSCNSSAGFATNIGSEHIWNSLQLGENVQVEEASVWNFFRRLSVSLQRLCCCYEKEESSIREVSPSWPRSLSMFDSFKERQRTCSLHHLQIGLLSCKHGGRFDCKQPVESKSYKEFKATGKFFPASSLSLSPFPRPPPSFNATNI